MAPRAKAAEQAETNDDVDATSEDVELRSGEIGEAELELSRSVAKRMGWATKEEWIERKRDPAKWRDGPDFLENTPKVIDRLQETADRSAKAAAAVLEDERRRLSENAERRVREAEDPEERVKAARDLATHSGEPAETVAWKARNAWFGTDPLARSLAESAAAQAAASRATIPEQLAEAEAAVRKRFPEYFTTGTEARLSDVRRAPPAVQSGTRAASSAPREKGFADLPRAAREAFDKNFRKLKLDPERYAKSYWRDEAQRTSARE